MTSPQRLHRERVLAVFFVQVEFTRFVPQLRRQIDVAEVVRVLAPMLPKVSRKARLSGLPDGNEEIMQSFFTLVFEVGLSRYDRRYSMTQYTNYLMLKACDPLQKAHRARLREGSADAIQGAAGQLAGRGEIAAQLQSYEQIVAEIRGLNERLAQAGLKVFVDGTRVKDAAEALGVTPTALSLRLRRVRSFVERTHPI